MPTANDELLDRAISHAIHLTRLRTGTTNEVLTHLNDAVLPDLKAKLAARLETMATRGFDKGPWTTKRLREIIRVTRAQVTRGMGETGEVLLDSLREIGVTEAEWQAATLRRALPSGAAVDLVTPGARQLGSIIRDRPFEGDLLKNWWRKLTAKAQSDISRQVQIGVTEGETNAAIIRRLAGTRVGRYMDGAFGGLRRNVAATVQTATQHVSTHAREMTYAANDDIIKGVEIVATLDSRTTEICMSEDGKVYDVGDGPRPPFHWNCRTTTVPVMKSFKEMGFTVANTTSETRASLTGQVPARTTYGSWLRRQPANVQDDALGPIKGRLFRKHKLAVDSFVDDKRRVLTIKEMRQREGLPA